MSLDCASDLALVEGQDRPVEGEADGAGGKNSHGGLYHAERGTVRVHERKRSARRKTNA